MRNKGKDALLGSRSLWLGTPKNLFGTWQKDLKGRFLWLCTLGSIAGALLSLSFASTSMVGSSIGDHVRLLQLSTSRAHPLNVYQQIYGEKRLSVQTFSHRAQHVRTSGGQLPPIKVSKVKLDGEKQEYLLASVLEAEHVVVAKTVATEKQNFGLELGSVSWGVWPLQEPPHWGAARINTPNGEILSYQVFCVDGTKFFEVSPGRKVLEYRDLLLQAAFVNGSLSNKIVRGQDKVDAAFAASVLSKEQLAKISHFREMIDFHPETVLRYIDDAIVNASENEKERAGAAEIQSIPLPDIEFDDDFD